MLQIWVVGVCWSNGTHSFKVCDDHSAAVAYAGERRAEGGKTFVWDMMATQEQGK